VLVALLEPRSTCFRRSMNCWIGRLQYPNGRMVGWV
jgi:hypothetical protein